MTPSEFSNSVTSEAMAIIERAVAHMNEHPETRPKSPPQTMDDFKAAIRRFAQSIALCPNRESAIEAVKDDPESVLCTNIVLGELPIEDGVLAIKAAWLKMEHEPSILPMHATSAYLMEIADNIEADGP